MKNILFRADSSSTIGTGHIMRDLVLASQYPNANIIFATQDLDGNINHRIIEAEHKINILESDEIKKLDHLIKKLNIDLLIIDHYGIDEKQEKKLKIKNPLLKIMALDDTYEKHECDILLNHNISADKKRYKGLVPKHCELRCGSEFTLLREEFIKEKNLKRVFIAMGGADHSNINIDILKVLKEFDNLEINLVTTNANKNLKKLKKYVENKEWINLHINSNKLAKLMKQSDFAIVTPSVTVNEILYMNIPFIAIKTADNQEEIYKYLKEHNFQTLNVFNADKLFKLIKKKIYA